MSLPVEITNSLHDVIRDAAYGAAQMIGQAMDEQSFGSQDFRNEVYLNLEGQLADVVVDIITESSFVFDA
jgi:hypothetical protein